SLNFITQCPIGGQSRRDENHCSPPQHAHCFDRRIIERHVPHPTQLARSERSIIPFHRLSERNELAIILSWLPKDLIKPGGERFSADFVVKRFEHDVEVA